MILQSKNINFVAIKILFFLKDADTDKVLLSNKISSGEKNYKCFIGYMHDDEIKPIHMMVSKTSAYVKSCWWS